MEESFLTNGILITNTKGKAELRARMARYYFLHMVIVCESK